MKVRGAVKVQYRHFFKLQALGKLVCYQSSGCHELSSMCLLCLWTKHLNQIPPHIRKLHSFLIKLSKCIHFLSNFKYCYVGRAPQHLVTLFYITLHEIRLVYTSDSAFGRHCAL